MYVYMKQKLISCFSCGSYLQDSALYVYKYSKIKIKKNPKFELLLLKDGQEPETLGSRAGRVLV